MPYDHTVFDMTNTDNVLEINIDAEDITLRRMATILNFLELWQGSQNLRATQRESCTDNKQMTAIGYISGTEEIVKAFWSISKHDGAAAFKSSESSPLPPALTAMALPGGWTHILNFGQINRIDHHPTESDEDSAPASIWDTENSLY